IFRAGLVALVVVATLLVSRTTAQTQPAPTTRLAPSTTPLDGLLIQRVEVVGNTRTPTNVILAQVRTAAGQRYSQALVDLDNRSIAALDIFLAVYPEVVTVSDTPNGPVTGVIVRFVVEEQAIVNSVQIAGNRSINDAQIREGLATIAG